jgi:hypothetical protein
MKGTLDIRESQTRKLSQAIRDHTVFVRSNAGIVGSNPTQGLYVCLCLFCVCVRSGLVMG